LIGPGVRLRNLTRATSRLMDQDFLQALYDQAPLCIHAIGTDGCLTAMNPAGLAQLGARSEDAIRGRPYLDFVSARDQARVGRLMAAALAGRPSHFEFTAAGPVSGHRLASCFIPCQDAAGKVERLLGITRRLSPRRRTEEDLRRLGRTQAVLARCNRSLARALDEQALLAAFCANLVEVGGYGFAWVGFSERRGSGRMRLMAHAGAGDGDFAAAVASAANAADARSACRVACASGAPVVLRDLSQPTERAPWADAARQQGFCSMIALPLEADRGPFGNFSIFADTPDAFDQPEVALLAELAEDLAFGLQTLRERAAQAQEVRALRNDAERDARGRLAASLHDGVGQTLQALTLGLKQARELAERRQPIPAEFLDRLVAEATEALREVRVVSGELRPPFLDRLPLLDAMRVHCSEMAQRSGGNIKVCADQSPFALEDRVKEQCFLAFREALSNALRHARASRILVILRVRLPDRLTLAVIDDGVGFDPRQTFEPPAGLGLLMIRERAAGVLGRARIRSARGRGTQVRICVPLTKEPLSCP